MQALSKQFTPYHVSVALRDAGFDEPCFATDDMGTKVGVLDPAQFKVTGFQFVTNSELQDGAVASPLYQQVFDWLEMRNIRIHDYWVYFEGKHGCNVFDKLTGKLLWPHRNFAHLQELHEKKEMDPYLHYSKRDAWNEAITEAIKLLKNG